MAWLGTWAKRIEITVDNTNIDSDLTHFPIPIILSSASGQSNDDLTVIFDEVGASWQKIAVTKADGTTQLYVEKEKWDDTAEEAVLWASKSDLDITSASTTTLYIYYDSTQADNTTYIAGVGSRTEVWDSNYKMVLHMAEGGGTAVDSTSNNNDASDNASATGTDGKVGDGQEFDGSDDYYRVSDNSSLDIIGAITLQGWVNPDNFDDQTVILAKGKIFTGDGTDGASYDLLVGGAGNAYFAIGSPGPAYKTDSVSGDSVSTDTWTLITGRWDGTTNPDNMDVWVNDSYTSSSEADVSSLKSGSDNLDIGADTTRPYWADGNLDEIRISNIKRSDAWIKADYYAMTDDLLEFGAEETIGVTVSVPLGELEITGYVPQILVDHLITVPLGELEITGYVPVVSVGKIIQVPKGELEITGYAPSIGIGDGKLNVRTGGVSLGKVDKSDAVLVVCNGSTWFAFDISKLSS